MKIQVSKGKTIAQLQDEFSKIYPYLKIAFFTKPHKAYKGSPAKFLVSDRDVTLGSLEKSRIVATRISNLKCRPGKWSVCLKRSSDSMCRSFANRGTPGLKPA